MKKLFLTLSLLSLCVMQLWSFDCSDMIIRSDRSRNSFFLKIFLSRDLTDQICIVTALGQRADSYVEDFIFGMIDHMNGRDKNRLEYLLRKLLDSVFHPTFDEDELGARVVINRKGINYLISLIHTFDDPMLKCQIMEIIPYVHTYSSHSYLMTEGKELVSILKKTDGEPGSLINGELICLLDMIKTIGDDDYFFLCQSIVQFSRSGEVVKAARETLKLLVSRQDEFTTH